MSSRLSTRRLMGPLLVLVVSLASAHSRAGTKTVINDDGVLVIDGAKIFPIGFTMPPPPDAEAYNGKNGIEELADAGATFLRTGTHGEPWSERIFEREHKYHARAARYGLH